MRRRVYFRFGGGAAPYAGAARVGSNGADVVGCGGAVGCGADVEGDGGISAPPSTSRSSGPGGGPP